MSVISNNGVLLKARFLGNSSCDSSYNSVAYYFCSVLFFRLFLSSFYRLLVRSSDGAMSISSCISVSLYCVSLYSVSCWLSFWHSIFSQVFVHFFTWIHVTILIRSIFIVVLCFCADTEYLLLIYLYQLCA